MLLKCCCHLTPVLFLLLLVILNSQRCSDFYNNFIPGPWLHIWRRWQIGKCLNSNWTHDFCDKYCRRNDKKTSDSSHATNRPLLSQTFKVKENKKLASSVKLSLALILINIPIHHHPPRPQPRGKYIPGTSSLPRKLKLGMEVLFNQTRSTS